MQSKIFASVVLILVLYADIVVTIWPKPHIMIENSNVLFTLEEECFSFEVSQPFKEDSILNKAINRYKSLIFYQYPSYFNNGTNTSNNQRTECGNLTKMHIEVESTSEQLSLNTKEDYSLHIFTSLKDGPTAIIKASTTFGAIYALETFSQLVNYSYSFEEHKTKYTIGAVEITDKPRFKHRGVMIDTARHYLGIPTILANIDAMAYNKMNVLHWHMSDDQAFPYVSKVWPKLSNAAYTQFQVYTQEHLKSIVEYGKERGVRVVVEFDSPSHSLSWAVGYPQILTACDTTDPNKRELIYPISDTSYEFLYKLYEEASTIFTDEYFHIGGDEVYPFGCWPNNTEILDFMKQKNWGNNFFLMQSYYEHNLLAKVLKPLNLNSIVWQEAFDSDSLPPANSVPHLIVQEWQNFLWQSELYNITQAGYKGVWYLNTISYGSDWTLFYNVEPLAFNGTKQQQDLVLGGEACLWAEYIDSTNFISRTWPRASAVAERLWSAKDVTNIAEATTRLEQLRCLLLKRGLQAEPQNGPSFCDVAYYDTYDPPFTI